MTAPTGIAHTGVAQWPVDNAASAVVQPGRVRTFGDIDRVYPLASVTKPLVAWAALVAIEEGALDLDTPAGPEGSTIRHLLAHASGLDFDGPDAIAAPGARRLYSNSGFAVLADAVHEHTEIPFPDYLREAVFEPLGMASSRLVGPAGSGAESTVRDLSRFAGELLEPTLISADLLTEATHPVFPGLDGILPGYGRQKPNDWGLGVELRDHKSPHWTGSLNSPGTFGHFGQSGTFLWVDPAIAAAAVVLTDRAFGDWAKPLWPELSDGIIRDITGVSHGDTPKLP